MEKCLAWLNTVSGQFGTQTVSFLNITYIFTFKPFTFLKCPKVIWNHGAVPGNVTQPRCFPVSNTVQGVASLLVL